MSKPVLPLEVAEELQRLLDPVPLELLFDLRDHLRFRGGRQAGGKMVLEVLVPHDGRPAGRWHFKNDEDRHGG